MCVCFLWQVGSVETRDGLVALQELELLEKMGISVRTADRNALVGDGTAFKNHITSDS